MEQETSHARTLRPLLGLAEDGEGFGALAAALAEWKPGAGPVEASVSTAPRPYLLAALLAAGERQAPALLVAPDDRSARNLAADARAFLAPRRVHLCPSRGTGYLSHVAPP